MHKLGKSFEEFVFDECKEKEISFSPHDAGTLAIHTTFTNITNAFEKWLLMAADEGLIKKVARNDIKLGLKVLNERGEFGEITECDDLHNVYVEFNEENDLSISGGYYCYVKGCDENSEEDYPLYIPV